LRNSKESQSSLQQEKSSKLLYIARPQSLLKMYLYALMPSKDSQDLTCNLSFEVLIYFSKCFLEKLGRAGLHKMVSGFEDHTAYAQCIFAYCENAEAEPKLFVGRCDGTIVAPTGENMFGWDPIFKPTGFEQTFAEMDLEEKNKISHRGRALE
jgi:hypothetical protein